MHKKLINNIVITVLILSIAFLISVMLKEILDVAERTTTVFVFAVYLISLWTDSYLYGIIASLVSVLLVHYAFTFPFYQMDFWNNPTSFFSAVIMIIIAILTSALTLKVKRQEVIRSESEKERLRANLLRAVSHDLRTPLTTIYGSAATLIENREILQEEQQRKILNGIKEDSEWLVRMVENLLSITRIDSGQVKIVKTPTVVDELIDSVMVKFNKRYPERDVEITIPEEILVVPMDAILIEQVLFNFLENAVLHATHMTQLSLRVLENEKTVTFEVQDNGCGIRKEQLQKIFIGYGVIDNEQPSDGQKHNTGIGLSVCATIIKAHDGEISAENVKEGGAVFRFTLMMEETKDDK